MTLTRLTVGCALLLLTPSAFADQPIMNEVPRWDGGYGVQVFQEYRWSDDLMRGDRDLPNPDDLKSEKRITHIEGVYTWRKWIRVTAKLPWVDQKRDVLDDNGTVRRQHSAGWDDIKLALPLRKYFNHPRASGNRGIVPQVRFGGDDEDGYRISDGSTDPGLSANFEYETAGLKFGGDVTYWWEQDEGDGAGDEWSIDVGLGWNFLDRGAISWETEYIEEHRAYSWLGGGPTQFWNFNDVVLGRVEYKMALDEEVDGEGMARGDSLRVGLGVVF